MKSIYKIILAALLLLFAVQVNFYFAWTSRVGTTSLFRDPAIRTFLANEVYGIIKLQFGIPGVSSYFADLGHTAHPIANPFTLAMKLFIDSEVILFTLGVFVISLLLFKGKGARAALLRAFEITSVVAFPLGIEIYFFDRNTFNIHASDIQVRAGFAWFTNADVLYLTSAILATTLIIEAVRYARSRKKKLQSNPGNSSHQVANPPLAK